MKKKIVKTIVIDGDYITNHYRDLYYLDEKSLEYCVDLLANGLRSNDCDRGEIEEIAEEIIIGNKKIVGSNEVGIDIVDDDRGQVLKKYNGKGRLHNPRDCFSCRHTMIDEDDKLICTCEDGNHKEVDENDTCRNYD